MITEIKNDFKEIFKTNEWLNFKKYCDEYTFWDILGMFRYEDANTNFLANFLDAKKDIFNLGTEPILKFISLICEKDKNSPNAMKIEGDFSNIGNLEKDDIEINLRKSYNFTTLHPDLVITIKEKYLILLEAKMEARESGENQCKDYYEKTDKTYLGKAFIYLSLSSSDKISDEEHYIKITYQDLIDDLYEPFRKNDLLNQYLKGFISLVKNNYISDDFKMPINKKEEKLVEKIYNNNKNVIDNFIKDGKKLNDFEVEIFFIVLYKILKEDKKTNDLADLIWKKYHNVGIIMTTGNKNDKEIRRYGYIMQYLITKLIENDYGIDLINSFTNTKYNYLYETEEFNYQNFTENQKKYYGDIEFNGKKYKILISYYYSEVIDFLNCLKSHDIKLNDIEIKEKQNNNILYPKS